LLHVLAVSYGNGFAIPKGERVNKIGPKRVIFKKYAMMGTKRALNLCGI
jgi:hypothetical protein